RRAQPPLRWSGSHCPLFHPEAGPDHAETRGASARTVAVPLGVTELWSSLRRRRLQLRRARRIAFAPLGHDEHAHRNEGQQGWADRPPERVAERGGERRSDLGADGGREGLEQAATGGARPEDGAGLV